MKKMKKIVSFESPYAVCEDQRSKYRHQSLLQDYEELQKEMEVMTRKLQVLKQKKQMLSTEVRFFRERRRYLMRNPSSKLQPQQDVSLRHNPKIQSSIVSKNRKYIRKESSMRPHIAFRSYAKERISNGVEAQLFDLDQNDRIQRVKDVSKKSITMFDLNQISIEEEELMGDIEHMKSEEPKRSARKGVSDEQHGDTKLSGCRSIEMDQIGQGRGRFHGKIRWH